MRSENQAHRNASTGQSQPGDEGEGGQYRDQRDDGVLSREPPKTARCDHPELQHVGDASQGRGAGQPYEQVPLGRELGCVDQAEDHVTERGRDRDGQRSECRYAQGETSKQADETRAITRRMIVREPNADRYSHRIDHPVRRHRECGQRGEQTQGRQAERAFHDEPREIDRDHHQYGGEGERKRLQGEPLKGAPVPDWPDRFRTAQFCASATHGHVVESEDQKLRKKLADTATTSEPVAQ
ncbi:hypothetical protein AJ88_03060 [Mesorhizobium amorphae CCBAU 01583]|nr:hypothetical protein AJ88_03060 [Mesorhizobium amorphae CCBAU 01583]